MYAEWYHRLRVTDSTTLQQQQQHQPEHYGRMFVFIRCLAVCLSVCMSIGICMLYMCVCSRQSVSTQPVVLFCRPVLSPICLHTRHIRGYSTTSLGPHPLPAHCQPTAKPTANPRKPRTTGTKIPAQLTEKHNYGASRVLTTQETTSTAIDRTITQYHRWTINRRETPHHTTHNRTPCTNIQIDDC